MFHRMTRALLGLPVVALLLSVSFANAWGQTYNGSDLRSALGGGGPCGAEFLTDTGYVVGDGYRSQGGQHAFICSGGRFKLDLPGCQANFPIAVNNQGQVIGEAYYNTATQSENLEGYFLYHGGRG